MSKADYQKYAKSKCDAEHWTNDDYQNLVTLWEKESGWSVTAGKPEKAYGIPQACPGSKMKAYGDDYLTNYITQINWGIDYIKSRYGNPTKALKHFNKKKWY